MFGYWNALVCVFFCSDKTAWIVLVFEMLQNCNICHRWLLQVTEIACELLCLKYCLPAVVIMSLAIMEAMPAIINVCMCVVDCKYVNFLAINCLLYTSDAADE